MADRSWAEWIAWQLENKGYSTINQAWDFRPGSNFVLNMDEATEAERTIAVLSQEYLNALYTKPEWAAAFVEDPTGKKNKLVPVRARECEPKGLLHSIIYIDLVGLDEFAAQKALLDGVSLERAKPTSSPIFPGAIPHSRKIKPRFPALLPSIWNVSHYRNPNFIGRKSLLNDVSRMLTSTGCIVLHGLGGVGKTQLAVEYAYNNIADYEVVWWIRSEESAILTSDYADLYPELNLPQVESQREVVRAVRHWMGQNTRWLLIFDNANSVDSVRDYLPQGRSGHVIITSRDSTNWDSIAATLQIKGLEKQESIDFLQKRSGQIDEVKAGALAEALGCLPLALEQAGAYIKTTGRSLYDYLKLFMDHQKEILNHGKPFDYPYTIATTWEISFRRLQIESSVSIDLLNLCAFLSPDDIPRDILVNYVEYLPSSLASSLKDPISFDENVSALKRYSLVEATEDSLSVHRLVQAVVRDKLEERDKITWAEAAIRLLEDAFPYDPHNVQTWDESARLLPHALAAAGHSEKLVVSQETTVSLLDELGRYLRRRAEFNEAKSVLERALVLKEKIYGKNDLEVAITLNYLGEVFRDLGDLEPAKKNSERALEICEKVNGPNHPETAGIVNNLGLVLMHLGDLEGAKRYITRALNIVRSVNKPNDQVIATILSNLGMVLQDLGDLEGAKKSYENAIKIDERIYKPDHINFARDLNNLAMVLKDLKEFEESKKNFERALETYEKVYGLRVCN
jgi:tetratricopeptide (TPR) repeat protein